MEEEIPSKTRFLSSFYVQKLGSDGNSIFENLLKDIAKCWFITYLYISFFFFFFFFFTYCIYLYFALQLIEEEAELVRLTELLEALDEFRPYQPEYGQGLAEGGVGSRGELVRKVSLLRARISKTRAKLATEEKEEKEVGKHVRK